MTMRHIAPACIPALFLAACIVAPVQDSSLPSSDIEEYVDMEALEVLAEEDASLRQMEVRQEIEEDEESVADAADMDADVPDDEADVRSTDATYDLFSEGVLTNGETKLIFFHAPWCPFCVRNDGVLQSIYMGDDPVRSTYKVDYDSSLDLRTRYGVVTQDTFVLVDGNGEKISSTIHPSESDLKELLR